MGFRENREQLRNDKLKKRFIIVFNVLAIISMNITFLYFSLKEQKTNLFVQLKVISVCR